MRLLSILIASFLATPATAAVTNWIDYENNNGKIAFPITIDGQEATAILDARVKVNGISRRLNDSADGDDVAIELSGLPVDVEKVVSMPLGSADILIGQEFFRDYVIQIDYPNHRIRFLDRDTGNLKKSANVKMKSTKGSPYPVVRVDVNGEDKPWLVLNPATTESLTLARKRAEKKGWVERFAVSDDAKDSEFDSSQAIKLPEFSIGPYTLQEVPASVPATGEKNRTVLADGRSTGTRLSGSYTKTPDGWLGYDVLKNFVVTIDFKRSLMRISEPGTEEG